MGDIDVLDDQTGHFCTTGGLYMLRISSSCSMGVSRERTNVWMMVKRKKWKMIRADEFRRCGSQRNSGTAAESYLGPVGVDPGFLSDPWATAGSRLGSQ